MAKRVKRPLRGLRYQRAHQDGTLRSVKRHIEKTYDFPSGSVQLVRPDGRRMREDAKVSRLREAWA